MIGWGGLEAKPQMTISKGMRKNGYGNGICLLRFNDYRIPVDLH